MTENELTYKIIHCAMEVYNHLGPGLLEDVYEKALMYELSKADLKAESQVSLPLSYKGMNLEKTFRIDVLVEDQVILELKSVEKLEPVHYKQLLSYLKLANKRLGYLINFNEHDFAKGYHRVVNGY
ncbi:MAG: GxxExxY protein [Bacteroidales bacterium]|nr:GxxExxY protein [Bacteroidales bacterium]